MSKTDFRLSTDNPREFTKLDKKKIKNLQKLTSVKIDNIYQSFTEIHKEEIIASNLINNGFDRSEIECERVTNVEQIFNLMNNISSDYLLPNLSEEIELSGSL